MDTSNVHTDNTAALIEEQMDKTYPTISGAFKQILTEEYNLFARKTLDYGTNNIKAGAPALDNIKDVNFSLLGIWFRISDKVNRWRNLVMSGRNPQNESLLDTLQDIAVYATIAQIIARGHWYEDYIPEEDEKDSEEGSGDTELAEGTR